MSGKIRMLRTAVPMFAMAGLALAVDGVQVDGITAQDRNVQPEVARVAPAPTVMLRSSGSGAYLGVYIREVTSEDVERLNLREERGALIAELPEEGPAAEAGLRVDDVIVSWNGSRIESASQLRRVVGETPAGRSVSLAYVRESRERTAEVELVDRPSGFAYRGRGLDADARARIEESLRDSRHRLELLRDRDGGMVRMMFSGGRLGVGVQNLGDQLAEYFGAEDGGVLVTSVREDSPAEAAGLRAGDVILRVGDQAVDDPGDVMEEIAEAEAGEIEIRVLRRGQQQTLRADLPTREEAGRVVPSGSAYFFGPEGQMTWSDGPWTVWQHTLDQLDGLDLPDIRFEMPDVEWRWSEPVAPAAPAEPTVRT